MSTESFKRILLFFDYEYTEFNSLDELKKYLFHNELRNEDEALKCMRKVLNYRISKILDDYYINIKEENEPIDEAFPRRKRIRVLKELKEDLGLKVPELFVSSIALKFGSVCFLIFIAYWILMIRYTALLVIIPLMINFTISLALTGLPILVMEFYQPGFMAENTFQKIKNYRMFLDQIILLNKDNYMEENNKRLKLEMEAVIDELFKSDNN